jgi:hypothetical protein
LAHLVREEPLPELSVGLLSSLFANRQLDLSRRLKPHRHTTVPTGRPLMVFFSFSSKANFNFL